MNNKGILFSLLVVLGFGLSNANAGTLTRAYYNRELTKIQKAIDSKRVERNKCLDQGVEDSAAASEATWLTVELNALNKKKTQLIKEQTALILNENAEKVGILLKGKEISSEILYTLANDVSSDLRVVEFNNQFLSGESRAVSRGRSWGIASIVLNNLEDTNISDSAFTTLEKIFSEAEIRTRDWKKYCPSADGMTVSVVRSDLGFQPGGARY